jgi:hypothetical protein
MQSGFAHMEPPFVITNMESPTLDLALTELESLPSREKIRERVAELEKQAVLQRTTEMQRFLRYIVRPSLAGSVNPVFAAEFTEQGERFERLWRRLR